MRTLAYLVLSNVTKGVPHEQKTDIMVLIQEIKRNINFSQICTGNCKRDGGNKQTMGKTDCWHTLSQ
jgi:hypothetical protein